jgi:hypothetical protein
LGKAGNISYHAKYLALPWEQSTSLPVCSTVLLPNPSMPTQNADHVFPPWQRPLGSTQFAETLRYLTWCATYPDQFVE